MNPLDSASRLRALLSPSTIAVVGASPDLHIFRGRTLKVMLGHPFAGRIYPVSRSHGEVQGLRAYPTVAAIPEPVDLAILIIPAEFVPDELERCGAAGVKAAMILASGFAETGSAAGQALQARVVAIAERHGMAVCGPNAEGYANTAAALCPTFSPAVDDLGVPLVPPWRARGHVAVVAQSGGMGFALFDRGRPRELPFSHVITTGNEACLEAFEIVDHLLDEGGSDVFLLFLESIKDPRRFERAAARALAAGKPIIVAKIGKTPAGARASRSHTGAIAGDHAAYQDMFRRHGILEATDLDDMIDLAAAFSLLAGRLPAGGRVGIATASGGGGGWLADACVAAGLTIPVLDAATRAELDRLIPSYGSSQNPVDATAQAIVQSGYAALGRLIAGSPEIDAAILIVSARLATSFEKERAQLAALARDSRVPIFLWSYTLPSPDTARILSQCGYPLFTSLQGCARAVAATAAYRAFCEASCRPGGVHHH
jgi:acyl-CoA synthetase (NDP forming)